MKRENVLRVPSHHALRLATQEGPSISIGPHISHSAASRRNQILGTRIHTDFHGFYFFLLSVFIRVIRVLKILADNANVAG